MAPFHILHFPELDSTNHYTELLDLTNVEEFTIVWADTQSAGKGQGTHTWHSGNSTNLTFSILLHPTFLAPANQYQLTKAIALGVADAVDALLANPTTQNTTPIPTVKDNEPSHPIAKIKWPNDIYINGQKICGILSSCHFSGKSISSAICGIGLNVNEATFPQWVPNPISLFQITRHQYNLEETLHQVLDHIYHRYSQLREEENSTIDALYLQRLLNLNQPKHYLYQGKTILATIQGVNQYGHLQLITDTKELISAPMGEISLLSM